MVKIIVLPQSILAAIIDLNMQEQNIYVQNIFCFLIVVLWTFILLCSNCYLKVTLNMQNIPKE